MEILVTLIIFSVGLLGLAALQTRAQQAEFESYQRAQALLIVEDIVNRIHTNNDAAGCYVTSAGTTGADYVGTGIASINGCTASGNTLTRALADADLVAWDRAIKGSSESLSGSSVGTIIEGRGCITAVGNVFTIAIAWKGTAATIAPTNVCAQGLYGDEKTRRVVSYTLRLPDLG